MKNKLLLLLCLMFSDIVTSEVMLSINDIIMITPQCLTVPTDLTANSQTRGEESSDFAPIGAKWYYDYVEDMTGWDNGYVLVESVSDTVIDDVPCRELVKIIYGYDHVSGEEYQRVIGCEYVTQINDAVMIYRDGEFKTLYDFGAEVGDTIVISGHGYEGVSVSTTGQGMVVGKGTIEMDGQTLRYIDVKQPKDSPWQFPCFVNYGENYTVRICEKIGSISGYLLPEPYDIGVEVPWEGGGALRCYSDSEINLSFSDKECDYIVGVDEISSQGSINIYPNPANDNITISLTADYNSIEIYDSFGRKVNGQQSTVNSQQVIDVDISSYPSGLYLVVVKNGTDRYYKRIVKN